MLNMPGISGQLMRNATAIHAAITAVPISVILFVVTKHSEYDLTSYHNLYFLLKLMEQVRQAIREDRLGDFREEFFEEYGFNKPNAKNF